MVSALWIFIQVHSHLSRQGHSPQALEVPPDVSSDTPLPRHTMQLFAVLCIQTSHYVSFVKYGPDPHSWLFFDSMADRHGRNISAFSPDFVNWLLVGFMNLEPQQFKIKTMTRFYPFLMSFFLTGDDQRGYSVPEIQACPELGDFLSQPEEELVRANPSQAPELVRRLLCDSYMFLYQNPATQLSKPNHQAL